MRFLSFVAVFMGFVVPGHLALAASTSFDAPEIEGPSVRMQATVDLPLEQLILGHGMHLNSLDEAKVKAAETGMYFAANNGLYQNDTEFKAAIIDSGPARSNAYMNLRFYGALLVFAAGCMMYLGLTVRRYP